MPDSSGLSPAFPRPRLDVAWRPLALLFFLAGQVLGAPLPDYLRTALAGFTPDAPAGWAYTIATTRNDLRMVERHDPSLPPATRWALLKWEDRAPSPGELEKYARSRLGAESGGTKANFQKDDIEPASLVLVREDASRAEWSGHFRETSTGADKMLGQLKLRLVVDKHNPYIAEYSLSLPEPYSPVLGVKMHTLEVNVHYHAPSESRPALPAAQTSRFTGRIFFFSTREDIEITYTEYTPPSLELSR